MPKLPRSLLTRGIDFVLHGQCDNFILTRALRMPEKEFLTGAKHAANAVHDSLRQALRDGDANSLQEMLASGLLAPPLHSALVAEVQRGQDEGSEAVALMLSELDEQSKQVSESDGVMTSSRMIIGAQRADAAHMESMHRLHVGSVLVVIDDDPSDLWMVSRQNNLMRERGCSFQVEVEFSGPSTSSLFGSGSTQSGAPPQRFLLEAHADYEKLIVGRDQYDESEHEMNVVLADMNEMTGGSFWGDAQMVKSWPFTEEA